MRRLLLGLLLAGLSSAVRAQVPETPAKEDEASLREAAIGFLSPAQQDRVIDAHDKALEDNPRLKKDDEELRTGWSKMSDAAPQERMGFMERERTHNQKLREAMLKEDPTLGPILDQIDKHISAMRAKRSRQAVAPKTP